MNNPIRFNDPTGHVCSDPEDPTPTCYGSGTTRVGDRIVRGNGAELGKAKNKPVKVEKGDNSCGQQGAYSSECPGWHYYTTTNVVCLAIFHCSEEEMIDYMSLFAYPNQDPSQPAESRQRYTVGIPIVGLDLREIGLIRFTTSNGGLTTTNTTLRPHILFDGKVERTARQNERGDWVVVTVGWGNNINPGMDMANQVGGPILFNTVDTQMFLYIATDQMSGP